MSRSRLDKPDLTPRVSDAGPVLVGCRFAVVALGCAPLPYQSRRAAGEVGVVVQGWLWLQAAGRSVRFLPSSINSGPIVPAAGMAKWQVS